MMIKPVNRSKMDNQLVIKMVLHLVLIAMLSTKSIQSEPVSEETKKEIDAGNNARLDFIPLPNENEGSLIWFNSKNDTQISRWVNSINEFLNLYKEPMKSHNRSENEIKCDFGMHPPTGNVCAVNVEELDPCTSAKNYSYNHAKPCIFLKLSKISGWTPEYYDDVNDLPEAMPENLQQHIKNLPEIKRKQVWISCEGENPVDQENLDSISGIRYLPGRGFPEYYFPYNDTSGYLSPLVALQVVEPQMYLIISIKCRAWAKNIKFDSVVFELLVD